MTYYVSQKGSVMWKMHNESNGINKLLKKNLSIYGQLSNICGTLVGNQIDDHSDVVGASPVSAAPTTSAFSTW